MVVMDLSSIPNLYSRVVVQTLAILLIPLIADLDEDYAVHIDSIHLSLPEVWRLGRNDIMVRGWSSTMLLERLDTLRSMGASLIISSPSISLVDRRLLGMLDNILLLPPVNPLNLKTLNIRVRGLGDAYVVSGTSVHPAILREMRIILEKPKLIASIRETPFSPRRTLISTLFEGGVELVSEFLQALRLSIMTRSEAVSWFKWRGVGGEDASSILDKLVAFQLVREVVISGRKMLTLSLRGLRALEEMRLMGVVTGED